jgi:glucosamine-6-phosphate deaminase
MWMPPCNARFLVKLPEPFYDCEGEVLLNELTGSRLRGLSGIELIVTETKEELYQNFAESILEEISEKNRQNLPTRLILPVGPTKQYPVLAKLTNERRISWKNVHIFHMDEYLDWQGRPISPDHPVSFTGFVQRFHEDIEDALRIPQNQVCFPSVHDIDGLSRRIDEVGGVDTCYGGIGVHGHIAFNEPPPSLLAQVDMEAFRSSLTRIVPLAAETVVMNATRWAGGNFRDFPPMAVTIGMRDILRSKRIRLYCDGGMWQREAVAQALAGQPSVAYPVTLLQQHPDVVIQCDADTVPGELQSVCPAFVVEHDRLS